MFVTVYVGNRCKYLCNVLYSLRRHLFLFVTGTIIFIRYGDVYIYSLRGRLYLFVTGTFIFIRYGDIYTYSLRGRLYLFVTGTSIYVYTHYLSKFTAITAKKKLFSNVC